MEDNNSIYGLILMAGQNCCWDFWCYRILRAHISDQNSKLAQMQLYVPEPNFEMILTAISAGSLLYIYPASASHSTPQNNQHVPYAFYLNHGTPTTPFNPTSYYPDTLPWQAPHVHTNTLLEFTCSTHLSVRATL
jgi:hypothetical protein